jgi:hypothetical protein
VRSNSANINNLHELRTALIAKRDAIPQRQIGKIIREMRKRCRASHTRVQNGQHVELNANLNMAVIVLHTKEYVQNGCDTLPCLQEISSQLI